MFTVALCIWLGGFVSGIEHLGILPTVAIPVLLVALGLQLALTIRPDEGR